jgi:hypothetical protein
MSELNALIDRYIDAWNETDPRLWRDLIARTWTETASYRDPALEADGREAIDRMIASVQERFPGHRFVRSGDIESHHEHARFRWTLGPRDGSPVVEGTDVAVIAAGRLASVIGFFDRVAQPA